MAQAKAVPKQIGFNSIKILRKDALGHGAYGTVYKALCDDQLLCAAKVLHDALVTTDQQQGPPPSLVHRLPIERFRQECEFLSLIRHPNIVLYLGISQDPDTNLPVLLMELMDTNLTVFLESSEISVPFHTQVCISHDIALAISFLHSNGIIHRDLSSNNILLIGDRRAKVTDFGMAMFEGTHRVTQTPGTAAYMPPEVKKTKDPISCDKTDVFSFGVLIIQIITRLFPAPKDDALSLWNSFRFEPEIEKRQSHISLIKKNHPLRAIACDCLKQKYKERPTSAAVCSQVGVLKNSNYKDDAVLTNPSPDLESKESKHEVVRCTTVNERYSKSEVVSLVNKISSISEDFVIIREDEADGPLFQVNAQVSDISDTVSVNWIARSHRAPAPLHRVTNCVVLDSHLYLLHGKNCMTVHSFSHLHSMWSEKPCAPVELGSLAIVNSKVVFVGGKYSSKLYTLIDNQWKNKLTSMPTKRHSTITASSRSHLIVIGGVDRKGKYLQTVEVMDTDTQTWSKVLSIPKACAGLSAAICGTTLYVMGPLNSIYSCKLEALINSDCISHITNTFGGEPYIWKQVKELPVSTATAVVVNGNVYAAAGKFSSGKPTTAIYRYNSTNDSWCVHSHLNTARSQCFAAAVGRDMVVIGGVSGSGEPLKTIEKACISRRY